MTRPKWRLSLLAPSGVILVSVAFFSAVFSVSAVVGERILHWPFIENLVGDPAFGDLSVLLAMADFIRENPGMSPYGGIEGYSHVPNYPLALPGLLAALGVQHAHLTLVGFTLATLVLIALGGLLAWAMSGGSITQSLERAAVLFLAFLSPPTMLLIERGNYDSLIFVLIAAACAIGVRSRAISGLLVLAASVFKLFPIAALIVFLKGGKGKFLPLILLALFSIYVLISMDEFASISQNTPRPHWLGFGGLVFGGYLEEFVPGLPAVTYVLFSIAVNLTGVGAGLVFYRLNASEFRVLADSVASDKFSQLLLQVGSIVILAAFLIGNSFDYRLIFLTLPLVALLKASVLSLSSGRVLTLGILLVLFWSIATYQMQPFGDLLIAPVLTILTTLVLKTLDLPNSWQRGRFGALVSSLSGLPENSKKEI